MSTTKLSKQMTNPVGQPPALQQNCRPGHPMMRDQDQDSLEMAMRRLSDYHLRREMTQKSQKKKNKLARQNLRNQAATKKGNNSQHEQERPQGLTDIPTQGKKDIKQKIEKELRREYDELQSTHLIKLEKLESELDAEREMNDTLQKQLEMLKSSQEESNQRSEKVNNELQKEKESCCEKIKTLTASHKETTERYEADLLAAREQANNLQSKFKSQKEKDELLIKQLTFKTNALLKNIEEMSLEQENSDEQNKILKKEIQDLKAQLSVRNIGNQKQHSTSFEAETGDWDSLEMKMCRLSDYHLRREMTQNLEKKKNKLAHQKLHNQAATKKGNNSQHEQERPQGLTDIPTQGKKDIKQKIKKELQREYDEMYATHVIKLEKLESDLDFEREKNDTLQKQLEMLKSSQQEVTNEFQKEKEFLVENIKTLTASHEATTERYEADLLAAREQADNLQCEFKSQNEKDELLIKDLTIKSNALLKNIEEMSLEQQTSAEQKRILQEEIEDLKAQLSVQSFHNKELQAAHIISLEKLESELDAEREMNDTLQKQLEMLKSSQEESNQRSEKVNNELQKEKESCCEKIKTLTASHKATTERYEADLLAAREQANNLQSKFKSQKEKDELLIKQLTFKTNALLKNIEEMSLEQENSDEQNKILKKEIQDLKAQLSVRNIGNQKQHSTSFEAETGDWDSLEMKMCRLSDYHLRREMTQNLEKKKNKLARQKLHNQAATKKGNNSQHEQERPQGLTDIPTQGKKDIKQKIKKELQREYDEMYATHVIKLEKLESDLDVEREKNDTLQKQLEMLKSSQQEVTNEFQKEKEFLVENIKTLTASHEVTTERYKADLLAAREQADNLQCEFKSQNEKDELLIKDLTIKSNALLKNIEEMSLEQQTSAEQKRILQEEIEDLKAQLSVQSFHNKELQAAHMISLEKLETKLNVEIEMNDTLQKQLEMLKSSQEESNQRSEKVINELQKEKESCCEKIKTLTASHKATTERYEADLLAAREQANNLQYEFKSQKEKDELLIKQLTIKSNALLKNIEEMSLEQENFDEQKRILQKEIEDLKAQLSVWTIHNEELQAAHVISLEKSETKLNVEIEKNDALQKQLEIIKFTQQESNQRAEKVINELQKEKEYLSETIKTLTASHEATTERYEADLLTAREQADNLQCEFKSQKEKDELLIKDLTIKSNALLKNIEEMSLEQENCAEQKRILTKEIEDLKAQLSVRTICNQEQHSVSLEAETHNLEPEVNQPEPAGDDKEENQTPDHQTEETNISNEPQRINTSAWKRFRHFLGLRKPKRWKKKLAEAEETE